jgi:hypothetical protein
MGQGVKQELPSRSELDQFIMERAGWRHPDDFPEKLYHYTSGSAFLDIIRSGELWFTDYRYLNDLSELKYGVDLFTAEITSREEQENDSSLRAMLVAVLKQFETARTYTDLFVFCMCAENNLLNQWRVYGRDTVPVSIELGTRGFMFVDWEPYSFEIVPMVYDTSRQNSIVSEAVSTGMEYASRHKAKIFKSDMALQSFVEDLTSVCVDWCVPMKHPQFEVEREWRLATRWGLEHRALNGRKHRASPVGIVPYLAVKPKVDGLTQGRLPIGSVTIGPCSQPQVQSRTVKDFLFQHDFTNVDVVTSDLPLRT